MSRPGTTGMSALLAVLVMSAVTLDSRRAEASDFSDANALYESGDFERAAIAYEEIVRRGVSHEDLFYNLGNAYFRVGRLGPAVYNYERALRVEPGFDDARYNLAVAREVIAERFGSRLKGAERPTLWIRVATFMSIGRLTFFAILFNVVFFAVLIGLRFLADGFARTSLIVTNGFVGGALLIVVVLLIGHSYYLERVSVGVVLPDQVIMREGADERRAERGLLHPGLRVEVIGSDPSGWVRVRLSNSGEGWVRAETIGRL